MISRHWQQRGSAGMLWRVSLISGKDGNAILGEPDLTIFTHLTDMPLNKIVEIVQEGL
jgi:hypothetical protein